MTERSNEELFEAHFSIAVEDLPQTHNSIYGCPEYKTGCPECGGNDRLSIFGGAQKTLARCWGKDQGRKGCGKVYLRQEFLGKEKETVHEAPKKKAHKAKPQDHTVFIEKAHSVIFKEKHHRALEYILKRGFTKETIKNYKIGAILHPQKGPAVILPMFHPTEYFQIRWVDWSKGSNHGKYENPKGKKAPYAIFGESFKRAFLVESLMDAMLLNEATGETTIAIMGAKDSLKATMLFEKVFYIPDADEAGENVARGVHKDHWIFLPDGVKDVGELIQEKGLTWTAEYLKVFTGRDSTVSESKDKKAKSSEIKQGKPPKKKKKTKEKETTSPPCECDYTYITTKEEAESAIEKFVRVDGPIALDTETTGLDCFNDQIRLIQIYHEKVGCFLFDVFKIGEVSFFKPMEQKHFVIHNASFDVKMLRSSGINLESFEDTMFMAAMTWPLPHPKEGRRKNLELVPKLIRDRRFSLLHLLKLFLDIELNKSKKLRVGWTDDEMSKEKLDYAALDVLYLLKIHDILREKIKKKGLEKIYNIYKESLVGFIEVEYRGAPVQAEKLIEKLNKIDPKKEKSHLQDIYEITNMGSNKQLTEHIERRYETKNLKRTEKSKQIDLSKKSLQEAISQSKGPVLQFFEDIRGLKAQATLYREHEKLLKAINKKTKRVHASYKVLQASSGRTLTENPNFQGQSSEVKAFVGFSEREDKKILSADYSQQELRVFALKTKNEKLLKELEAGNDGYKAVASAVTGRPPEEITKEERKLFKMVTLAVLYGKGSRTLAQDLGIKQKEAAEKLVKLQETLDVNKVQRDLEYEHETLGYISTIFGKEKRPIIDKWRTLNSYQLINYFIQGTAANIGIIAFEKLRKTLPASAHLIGYVHDEFLVELPEGRKTKKTQEIILRAMQDAFVECFPNAEKQRKHLVEINISNHWQKE